MGNLTSTLSVKLLDDVSGPAGRAGSALRGLAASGNDLKKLAAASPEAARLARELERLRAAAGKLDTFKVASRGLDDMGLNLRKARQDIGQAERLVARRQKTIDYFNRIKVEQPERYAKWKVDGLTAGVNAKLAEAKRGLARAQKALPSVQADFMEQGRHVRTLRNELGTLGLPLNGLRTAEASLKASIEATNAAIAKQPALIAQAAAKAETSAKVNREALRASVEAGKAARAKRANASSDMIAGMGASGRGVSARIDAGRRVAEGMGAPARADRAARARTEREAAEAAAERRSELRAGKVALAGLAGVAVSHKVKEGTHATLETYREFDKERRFGKAVMGLTDEEQKPLVDQAIHMGASTRYNDVQVLEAQRELAARGLKRDQVMGLMEPASDLGGALDLSLPSAVKQMEGALFGFKKPMATLQEAMASAKQTADVQVKAAKISGMTPEDISQAYKYGATPARMSGVSEENLLAFAGISKKANMGGDESGVAFRALIAAAQSPTRKGKEAMLANGLDYKNYQRNPDRIDTAAFSKTVAAQYGVKLDKGTLAGIDKIFTDKAMIASPEKFTPAVMKLLSDNLGGDDAKSKKSIAGLANRFRDASQKGVDTNGLITDLMKKLPDNLQLANAIFGAKQGSRIATALGDPEIFRHMIEELVKHSEGYAGKINTERNAGYDGAMKRFEGATKNLETALARSMDNEGRGGFLTKLTDAAGKATMALAELPQPVLAVGAAAAWVGGKVSGVAGTVALVSAAFSLKGSAAALTAAAARLGLGGAVGAAGSAAGSAAGAAGAGGAAAAAAGGSKVAKVAKAAGGALAVGALATAAQEFNILQAPEAKDGWGKGVLKFLDPRIADMVYGADKSGEASSEKPKPLPPNAPAPTVVGKPVLDRQTVPLPPARPTSLKAGVAAAVAPETVRDPVGDLARGASPDAGRIEAATAALGRYRTELEGIKADLATGIDMPGIGTGLEARKAELEGLIAGVEAKLKSLGTDTIAPKVDTAPLDGLGTAADTTHGKLSALDAMSVSPKGDPSGLLAIEGVVDRLISKMQGLGASIASAKAQAASVSVPSAGAGSGGRSGQSSGLARRELGNNFT